MMVQEEDGLQLPSALRMAANSGLGKKKKKHGDRMDLKSDAKAMRLRLAEMDGRSDKNSAPKSPSLKSTRSSSRSRPTKSLSIDISRTRPTNNFRPTKSRSIDPSRTRPTRRSRQMKSLSVDTLESSGKYSNEVLNKKIKKVKKMLSESDSGSKEFKALQKKLVEYRAQLKEQKQSGNNHTDIADVEAEEWIADEEPSDSLSDETVEEDQVDEKRVEVNVEEKEDQNTYSLDMLKKKLKKVEKMLRNSTPDSKEYKKLQKKRIEYESQISGQDADDSSTDEGDTRNRFRQSEKPETVRTDSTRDQSRLSWQRAEKDPESKPSVFNIHTNHGQDEKVKKQAYLEEARRLKQDALEKKRREKDNDESEKRYSSLEAAATRESQSESSDDNEVSNYSYAEQESQRKKQEYLEEARRLKQDALEKKRREEDNEELEKRYSSLEAAATEESQSESSDDNEVSNYSYAEQESQRKKQEYLEEARRLKREALEKKMKEEEFKEEPEESPSPTEILTTVEPRISDSNESEEQRKKKAYLEEARTLKREASEKKRREEELRRKAESKETEEASEQEFEEDEFPNLMCADEASHVHCGTATNEIESKVEEKQDDDEQQSTSTSSSDAMIDGGQEKSFYEFKMKIEIEEGKETEDEQEDGGAEEREQGGSSQSTDPPTQRKKSNFLSEIISKAKGAKKEKRCNDSIQSSPPVEQRKKSNFLNVMLSKSKGTKEEKRVGDSTQSTDTATHQKNPSFLDDIKSRTKGESGKDIATQSPDPATHQKKPSLLDDIKSKANGTKGETGQGNTTQSPGTTTHQKKPSFLDDIKSKAKGVTGGQQQQISSTSGPASVSHGRKPNFLEELRLKAGGRAEDEHSGESTPTSDQCLRGETESASNKEEPGLKVKEQTESNIPKNNPNTESVEAAFQQSEQTDGSGNMQSPEEEAKKTAPAEQEGEASKGYLDRRTLPQPLSNNSKKILRELESNEIRQKKLERSLIQNGIQLTEEISYEEAKDKIAEVTDSMKALIADGMESYTAEKEYFRLEEQLSKYSTALMLTDEYAEEVRRLEQDWEESVKADNIDAIRKLRSHMPVNIRHLTEEQLVTTTTPNGKTLPRPIARKFKRTNILQLLRVDPDDIEMMHPSLLEGMRTTSLTLTERRALHEHFSDVVQRWTQKRSDPSIEKKWQWCQSLKSKFKETLSSYLRGDKWTIKADSSVDYSVEYGYTTEATYEGSGNKTESKKASPRDALRSREKSSKVTKSSEAEILQEYRDRLRLDPSETEIDKKLLRELSHSGKRTKTLEKQLTQAGLSLPKEDISYDVAKARIAELTEELNKVAVNMGNTADRKELAKFEYTFGSLSQDLDKFTNALMLTKEWVQEQQQKERKWETDISAANLEALKKVRRYMPVNIRNMSEASLTTDLTPNGKVLPKAIARKFKRTNILMILRTDPSAIESMHPSSLEAMRTTGLTLTERRAMHEHLKDIAPKWKAMSRDKMCERKWMWHASLQSKLKEMLANHEKHVEQYGRPKNADDYSEDYGYPDTAEYEQQTVAKSNLLSMEELEKRRLEDDYY